MSRSTFGSTLGRWFLALVLVVGIGCPGDYQAPPDTQPSQGDYYGPTPDWPQVPADGPQWPDYGQPDMYQQPPDLWYWPPDTGYIGSPFGCQKDSDCFGLKCCPTPWGVKLCADTCPK